MLHKAGLRCQNNRACCPTDSALQKRKRGLDVVTDSDAGPKKSIEDACCMGETMGLPVSCTDQAGPFQRVPHAGSSWRPEGDPPR